MAELTYRPIEEAGPILVGPMVRRVTHNSVSVFVATNKADKITLRLSGNASVSGEAMPKKLGEKLYVALVEATPSTDLEPGVVYHYDIEVGGENLSKMGLLKGDVPLGYDEGELPSFVLPGGKDTLKIAHGSCRKPHGGQDPERTDPDTLPIIDRLIQDNRDNASLRPQQLLLTGDQIYSDDVAPG